LRLEPVEYHLTCQVPWIDNNGVDANGKRGALVVNCRHDRADQILVLQHATISEVDSERRAPNIDAGNGRILSSGHQRLEQEHHNASEAEPMDSRLAIDRAPCITGSIPVQLAEPATSGRRAVCRHHDRRVA
jgi:hypothetical protein